MLSEQAINEYMKVYKQTYHVEISRDEASRQGEGLLRLFKLIYRPVPKVWVRQQEGRQNDER